MYVRPDGRQRSSRNISIPQNYSGSAFTESENESQSVEYEAEKDSESEETEFPTAAQCALKEKKGLFSGLSSITDNDDLIIIGLILLLSQDSFADDIIPILIIMLFLRK